MLEDPAASRSLMTIITAAHTALDRGDFDAAFDALEDAARATRDARARARLVLETAAVYSLYGRDGVDGGLDCLADAVRLDPRLRTDPLQLALRAELTAHELDDPGKPPEAGDPRAGRALELATGALSGPPEARFHAAAALVTLGEAEPAAAALEALDPASLPPHLRWRYWSWRGAALEDLGRHRDAESAYAQGASLASGTDRAALLLDRAAMQLELDEAQAALGTLADAERAHPGAEPPLDRASRLYLEARAHLGLDNPGLARERAEAARAIEREQDEPSYGAALVHGQALATLEDWDRALEAFRDAVRLAGPLDEAYALHEMGLAQMDAGHLEDARESLERAAREDEDYPHRGEVFADLAEVEYRVGRFDEAEAHARRALDLGATVPASLLLANLAYEYFRLDEALGHYRRVLQEAPEGSREWVIAHEMIADTLVQDGWRDPRAILEHARVALPHLDASDEWAVTLSSYVNRAEQLLQGAGGRTLN